MKGSMHPIGRRRSRLRPIDSSGNNDRNSNENDAIHSNAENLEPDAESSSTLSSRQKRRRSSSLKELAKEIARNGKRVVFITGAGISVASGVRQIGRAHV